MVERCAECGAVSPAGSTCQSIFDECLALEYTDPAYGKVHILTVACFMIQHGRYSDEALTWIEAQLQDHLEHGVAVQHIRQKAAQQTRQTNRTWKVLRPVGAAPLPSVAWSVTLADVAPYLQDAEKYCQQIERWALATLQEMKQLHSGGEQSL